MHNKITLLISLFISIYQFSYSQKYTIIETKTNQPLSLESMIDKFSEADIILFGEEHNDNVAHELQLQILEGLFYLNEGNLSLSMEMWERDVQHIMDEYLLGFISEKNFKRESRAWNNYEDYKPLIEFAKENQINVVCANTPARYTNMVTRGSLRALTKLPNQTKRNFLPPLPIDTLSGDYYEKFKTAMGGHLSPNMYLYHSQNLWDATMTHSILQALSVDPFHKVLHITGRFHSDNDLGITSRLKNSINTKYKTITISSLQKDDYDNEDLDLADFIILTGNK